jgi:hypothetical protein
MASGIASFLKWVWLVVTQIFARPAWQMENAAGQTDTGPTEVSTLLADALNEQPEGALALNGAESTVVLVLQDASEEELTTSINSRSELNQCASVHYEDAMCAARLLTDKEVLDLVYSFKARKRN